MGVLSNLEPREVFAYFEEICGIPHPSYQEKKLSDYCVEFARSRGLEVHQDSLGNVIIIREATPGYEEVAPLIMQGHLDMVCEKEPGCDIDFERDGLRLQVEGDYITAEGTTLGGDDGIAVAYILAILASDSLEHPRIEAVFTVSEEVGMDGAKAIDLSPLQGHKLLNIDSEEEGYLLTSCAGGCRANVTLPAMYETRQGCLYEITVDGLLGGHSGVEIDKGRANANLLLGRAMMMLRSKMEFSVVSLSGGLKDNAIPRKAQASIMIDSRDAVRLESMLQEIGDAIAGEYMVTDPEVRIILTAAGAGEAKTLTEECASKVITLINLLPNGVQTMSANIKGLVETSLNLGILTLDEKELSLHYAVRSSVRTAKEYVVDKLRLLARELGGGLVTEGDYPEWAFRKDSPLREDMVRVYREMYGKDPVIQAIHAGLECGLLADKIRDLDAVSFGPDMVSIHTTEEKLSISSTKRVWDYIVEVIRQK
ncbi:aminoacyl-histidine dipeptidase [Lachnospiraceae bacterium JLR.KK008]